MTEVWTAEEIAAEFKAGKRQLVLEWTGNYRDLRQHHLSRLTGKYRIDITDHEVIVHDKPRLPRPKPEVARA